MTLDKAKKLLEEKGLKLGVASHRNDDNYLPGQCSSSPNLKAPSLTRAPRSTWWFRQSKVK